MFAFNTETVIAGSLGTAIIFIFARAYSIWRKWSIKSKTDDEIDIDRKIAEAIKNGDVLLVAKLKKYYQSYAKRNGIVENNEKSDGTSPDEPSDRA